MIVFMHVSIALSSLAYTTYLFFVPSTIKFKVGYGLVAATLISGVYLVLTTHSNLLSACRMGITYLSVVSIAMFVARRKLVKQEQASRDH